jgi:hypothetical protein
MSEQLKPCPFCGSERVEYHGRDVGVVCNGCGSTGPHDMESEAWNDRAAPKPVATEEDVTRVAKAIEPDVFMRPRINLWAQEYEQALEKARAALRAMGYEVPA